MAVEEVFPGVANFICHFHFLRLVVRRFAPNNQRILLIRIVVEARSVLDNDEFSGFPAGTTG